jgi:ubiquinone biosynthesis protein
VLRGARFAAVIVPALARYRWLEWRDARSGEVDLSGWARAHEHTARGFARLGEELGGLYVKLCQVAGARADVFPAVFVRELGRFHDRVTPRPFAELAPTLERELGRPLGEVFARIEPTPVAAASLAQVHRAVLPDGSAVALKIQYPDAARLFAIDLANVRRGAAVASWLFPSFTVRPVVEEVAGNIARELDFARELASLERTRADFAGDPDVRIPRAYPELCTPHLLVLEYLDGTPIHDLERLRADGVDLPALADRIARLYARMIFEKGFFHGDPHPGNLLVLPSGQIGLLDFGLAKALPDGFGANLVQMFASALRGDAAGALVAAKALGFSLDGADPDSFMRALGIALGARHDFAELRDIFGGLAGSIPPDIALVIRTIVLLNGLSERLAPGERRIVRELVLGASRARAAASA